MATKVKITNVSAEKLRGVPGVPATIYWDADLSGFGVRAYPSGKAVYFVQYRDKLGKQAKLTLGDVSVVKADKAREQARTTLSKVQLGGNPQRDLQAQRQGDKVSDLVAAYLTHAKAKLKPRSYTEVERALNKAAKPLHPHKATVVTRREVASLLDKIATTSGPFAANRTRANLSAMWTWALKAGRVEGGNPVAYTNVAAKEVARDRVLTDDEVALIWRATDTGHEHDAIVRLLLLTAARREEVGAMRWEEVGEVNPAGGALWTLPKERAKNGMAHETALTALAYEQMPAKRGAWPTVFGKAIEGSAGFSGWSKCKARLDGRMLALLAEDFTKAHGREPEEGEVTVAPWRLHDLRRTFSTCANESGIEPHVVEAVLNHVSGVARRGVAGVYNRAQYRTQKQGALAAWESHIRLLVGLSCRHDNEALLRRAV